MAPACKGIKIPKRNYSIFEEKELVQYKKQKMDGPLKIISWNVAGLRACLKKGCQKEIDKFDADIVLLQETKCKDLPLEFSQNKQYIFKKLCVSKEKNGGYAGVAFFSKEKPISVKIGIDDENFDSQGRLIQAEFDDYFIVNVYVPNSGQKLVNLDKRAKWEAKIRERLQKLDLIKPVLYVGDLNVAHEEIDLKNPKLNMNKTAGFTDQERQDFSKLLNLGFVDVFRHQNPNKEGAYTFWSYLGNQRSKNVGWRLDYFVISRRLIDKVLDCTIHSEIMGSDHCPISLTIQI